MKSTAMLAPQAGDDPSPFADKPQSKERQEYETQKEREALERFHIATGQGKPEQVMQRALVELADKIERMNPPGDFEPVEIPLTLGGRKGMLRFAPSPSKPGKR